MYCKPLLTLLASGVALGLPAVGAVCAAEIEKAEFVVELRDDSSDPVYLNTHVVPLMPESVCFGWRMKLSSDEKLVFVKEVLKLPAAPTHWAGEGDAYSTIQISRDRTTATTSSYMSVVDGWVENFWCVSEGDPTGQCSLEISMDGKPAGHFDFQIVPLQ